MQKLINSYGILLCFILTLSNQVYAQICGPCGLNLLDTITTGGVANPTSVAYSPNGNCLAVVNQINADVSVFSVNQQTCALTPVSDSPFTTAGINPVAAVYSPNGSCLVVTNAGIPGNPANPGSIIVFQVNLDCTLTPRQLITYGGGDFAGLSTPVLLAFSPVPSTDGSYCLAVVNQGSNNVSIFTLDATTCQLEFVNTYSTGSTPLAVQYSPDGTCLVVSNLNIGNAGTLSLFSVDQATCALTEIGTSPISSNGFLPSSVTYFNNGQCLAVVNSNLTDTLGPTNISIFSVGQDCGLTLIPENTIELEPGSGPFAGALSPDSSCFAVANIFDNTVTTYAVNTTGCQLTPVGDPITVGSFPRSLTYSPNGTCLVVTNSGFHPLETTGPKTEQGSISLLRATANVITIKRVFSTCLSPASVYGMSAQPGATVRLYADDTLIAASIADSEGNFFMANLPVSVGNHCFIAEDVSSGCISSPICADIKIVPTCHLITPNLSLGMHYSR